MFGFEESGSWADTIRFLERASRGAGTDHLEKYGKMGVQALQQASPKDTGEMGSSWEYRIVQKRGGITIEWYNTDSNNGANIAILVQYGHGTGTGGYVEGRDFINPAMRPIFDEIAKQVWKEVAP